MLLEGRQYNVFTTCRGDLPVNDRNVCALPAVAGCGTGLWWNAG